MDITEDPGVVILKYDVKQSSELKCTLRSCNERGIIISWQERNPKRYGYHTEIIELCCYVVDLKKYSDAIIVKSLEGDQHVTINNHDIRSIHLATVMETPEGDRYLNINKHATPSLYPEDDITECIFKNKYMPSEF